MTHPRPDSRFSTDPVERIQERLDRFFLPASLDSMKPEANAQTRMGLRLSLVAAVGTLLFLPLQLLYGTSGVGWLTAGIGGVFLALPFALRQREAIRHLGPILCSLLAFVCLTSIVVRSSAPSGMLPFLPVLPIIGFLVRGSRGALLWGCVAFAIGSVGMTQALVGSGPLDVFPAPPDATRYGITLICIAGVAFITQSLETLWDRAALDAADLARAELIEEEERNRSLLEYASEGVMVVSGNAVVKFASPAAERLVGVGPGEAVGRRLRDFTVEEDFLKTRPAWVRVAAHPNGVEQLQLRTRPGLGRGDPAESRVLAITVSNRLDSPAIAGVIVRMRDVTELARAEANYEALVEHSLQGIAVSCDREVVYVNQSLADLFGVDRDRMLALQGNDGMAVVHRDDRSIVEEAFHNSTLDDPGTAEMRVAKAGGGWRWIQLKWTSASWEGRPARQIAYADITAEKELAAQHERLEFAIAERTRELEQSQRNLREQERMASVGTLAAGIAHQINNPIGAILTSADFAILVEHEEGAEKIRSEALSDIRAQAVRCGKIVRSVLQFARAEPTEKWPGDPTAVLRTAIDVTARYADERNARITLDLSPKARISTLMNPIEIEQVFVNLIRNAIESRPMGASIRISTRMRGEQIEIAVEDNGPGVPPVHARHIFDPFYTTRLRQGGTGLGLSVAHGIVEDHGGQMLLDARDRPVSRDDKPPSGARFIVRLPTEKSPTRV